nr:RNA-directed DNA polymerase, eukaryota [Tanacetum cinerariifolium]
MGSSRSKEDDLNRISTSIFVTNFPESTFAKELFHHCKQYGHVVDAYIPVERTRSGKRFRFQRPPMKKDKPFDRKNYALFRGAAQNSRPEVCKDVSNNSYVNVAKSNSSSNHGDVDSCPAIVMDDDCLNSKYVSNALLVKIEGIPFKLWSGNSFKRVAAKWGDLLDVDDQGKGCSHTKRLCLYTKLHTNIFKSFKMIFHGKVFWIHAKEVLGWIHNLLDDSDDEEDGSIEGDNNGQDLGSNGDNNNGLDLGSNGDNSDLEAIPETSFEASNGLKKNNSDDPFNIYSILNRTHKVPNDNANVVNSGPAFPPGFTHHVGSKGDNLNNDNLNVETTGSDDVRTFGGSKVHSACPGSFKKSIASGGSFLNVMEEVVKVGQTMGFNMEGCEANLSEIIKSQGASMQSKRLRWRLWISGVLNVAGAIMHLSFLIVTQLEIREDRFGYAFNVQDTDEFNSFIITAGLVEVPLGVIDKYKEDLGLIDSDINSGKVSDRLVAKRMEILNDLQNMEKLHAMDMAQKAKIKWSTEGDESSRKNQAMLNKNFIITFEIEKSPGPDGFSFGFYRQFWATIEKDVFKAINHFFTHADIPKGCNSSFITLIPKIPDANLVKDFRPISLIGSIYKIIAKILTNRLIKVIWDIALIFKVDFEKAFDSVRWDFLDDVLRKFGFGNKWCEWIQNCLMSSRGSILINGSPTEEFQFFKGLKQGDPLSPFLFILVMECLLISFQKVVDAGMFTGISLNQSVILSHMFYADDAVFVVPKWVVICLDQRRGMKSLTRVRSCWTSILKEVKELQKDGVNVFDWIRIKLGNGESASFWHDNWSGAGVVKDLFPRIFALENHKE